MTSPLEQKKIRISGPSMVTANRTWDGVVIYRTAGHDWSAVLSDAAIVAPRDMRQRPQLLRRKRAVGDCHAEHVGVQLQVDAVLQPQHLEFVLGEFAGQPAFHLIAEFLDAFVDDGAIEFVICVHG